MLTMGTSIVVEAGGHLGVELESEINKDINTFEAFFQTLGNEGLAGPERAILKTYLIYKTHTIEQLETLRKRG